MVNKLTCATFAFFFLVGTLNVSAQATANIYASHVSATHKSTGGPDPDPIDPPPTGNFSGKSLADSGRAITQ